MLPQRRSIRLQGFDYATPAFYFVTICTFARACTLGRIVDAAMQLTEAGRIVQSVWLQVPARCGVQLDRWVLMPNHLHGVIGLPGPASPISLPEVIRGFKTFSARAVNRALSTPGVPLWQRGYYEHIIRSEIELERVRQYIEENPGKWFEDRENPERVDRASAVRRAGLLR